MDMTHLALRILIGALSIGLALALPVAAAPPVNVAAELERLMEQYGFEIRGIELTESMEGRAEGDDLVARLRMLLDDFDHVIVQQQSGGVERIIILGEKVAVVAPPVDGDASFPSEDEAPEDAEDETPEEAVVLPTQREGTSHAVSAGLEGANGRRVQRVLLIDTGADHVVLPASLIVPLGISPNDLRPQSIQTANGMVQARLGTLTAVWLGDRRVGEVSAAFIDDARLGGNALLGMSLLGRFRVTIDDEQNQLTLTAR